MTFHDVPYKVLEINVISAEDLLPVSKQLRTYIIAWIHPDDKLTTRVDHNGHTNPTWNYKLLFQIDNDLLYSDTSSLTIEIYNMAWLRDTPVGTTNVLLKHLVPPPSHIQSFRRIDSVARLFSLQISRPSGQSQGILNLGAQVLGTSNLNMPLGSEVSVSTVLTRDINSTVGKGSSHTANNSEGFIPVLHRSRSEKTVRSDVLSSISTSIRPKYLARTSTSVCSYMHVIPSEVAVGLKKGGLYSTGGEDYGSSILENWTELEVNNNTSSPRSRGVKSRSVSFKSNDDEQLIDSKKDQKRRSHRRCNSDGVGLFSCFGNAYGIEFTVSCGSKSMKKNRIRSLPKNDTKPLVRSSTESSPDFR